MPPTTSPGCEDDLDNDGDGWVDSADPDCQAGDEEAGAPGDAEFVLRYPCHVFAQNVAREVGYRGPVAMLPNACAAGAGGGQQTGPGDGRGLLDSIEFCLQAEGQRAYSTARVSRMTVTLT